MYPALAVLQALEGKVKEILWVGGEGGMEAELVQRLNIPFKAIPAAGLHGVGMRSLPSNLSKLSKGVNAARKILAEFKPNAILYTGGFIAAPMAVAAGRTPSLLFVPDIEPGLAIKFLARFVRTIAVTSRHTATYFQRSHKIIETGYPVRTSLQKIDRREAISLFSLEEDLPVALFFGGSKGAHSINQAVQLHLEQLLAVTQIIHISGIADWPELSNIYKQLPTHTQSRYKVYPYLHEEMSAAFSAADLAISRAGASALGEYPLFKLPAILVPYPFAWRYQKVNADYLVNQGAAVTLSDEMLESELLPTVLNLLAHPEKRESMASAMAKLARPNAAEQIGQLILDLSTPQTTERGLV